MKSKKLKKFVSERAQGCCEYCFSQSKYAPDPFSIEHIMPRSKGGTDDPDNLAWACMGCNGMKYNETHAIDPVTMEVVGLFHPRTQKWSEHFQWNTGFTHVFGRTPTGRATIEKLGLNRAGVVNLRAVLAGIGEHPPF
ncbi:MAG TPA: HNH endonuclease signature motif containing protein [Saprospiraceae bacterium]|nr:HNH endonuclease signature motif containing protein [Saprospiraceae bacterium]HPI07489.1 HNH endonuclease signature motif containing protein [Saprospiraceae bacterium]